MANALLLLAEGFEETEAVTVIDVLRRAGIAVTVAALHASPVRGSHDIALVADTTLTDVQEQSFDALVLPGGMPGAKHLREDSRVLELVRRFVAAGKLTAAVCAGPTVLEAAGVLTGRRATSYPGHALPSAVYQEAAVVEDGPIVTSRGVGTSLEFALALVARLADTETAELHRARLLAPPA
ncbi:MAG TPA: DJ-1 family glyoxalase III [Polyangiaceae bacterium]|nr:DJ-1 family glyoxalase III [Polyangiaceae bacterium]